MRLKSSAYMHYCDIHSRTINSNGSMGLRRHTCACLYSGDRRQLPSPNTYLRRRRTAVPPSAPTCKCHQPKLAYKRQRTHDAKPKLTRTQPHNTISSVHQSLPVSNMAKCLAVALLLLVVLAYCDGRELNQKDQALATARGAGGGVGEEKILGLPELPLVGTVTGTSTVTGPVVVVPALPGIPAHP
jgi:hypothetical protein